MSDLPLPEPVPVPAPMPDEALDIQHDTDPAQDHGPARRIPHFGHALLFFALTLLCLLLGELIFLIKLHISTADEAAKHLFAAFIVQLVAYIVTLASAVPIFSLLWHRSFLDGIQWTWRAARLHWWKLVLLGIGCSMLAQLADNVSKVKDSTELLHLFQSPLTAWIVTLCGVTIVPLMEEIAFRGFLLPALATAYDWFSLERTPAGIMRWQRTTGHTRNALIFGAVISSIGFTLLHGSQIHWAHWPLAVLFVVSMVFAAVRIRMRSVAASTLVHLAYDGLIFLELIVSTGGFRHLEQLK